MSKEPDRSRRRVLVVAGTRPEALKLVALVRALGHAGLEAVVVGSGQHPRMVAATFAPFGIVPDESLPHLPPGQSLSNAVRFLRDALRGAIVRHAPAVVVVQGDTSTAYAGALAGFAERVPVAHVEAGLRTDHPLRPFPEELFRRRIGPLADFHYAPTERAAANLVGEGTRRTAVVVVGNSIVDALRETLALAPPADTPDLSDGDWMVLTLHRRENYGRGLEAVCDAVLDLLAKHERLRVLCPVHPNPTIGARMRRRLGNHPQIRLTDPLPYAVFIHTLAQTRLVLTDSGGIQEEAPYLGVPVLVARENTERPEALESGTTRLVPVERQALNAAVDSVLASPRPRPCGFDANAPFGDGRSAERIAAHLARVLDARDAAMERLA